MGGFAILVGIAVVAGAVTFFRPIIGALLVLAAFVVPTADGYWTQHDHPCNPTPPYQPDGCWDSYIVTGEVTAAVVGFAAAIGAGIGGVAWGVRRVRSNGEDDDWEAFQARQHAEGTVMPADPPDGSA